MLMRLGLVPLGAAVAFVMVSCCLAAEPGEQAAADFQVVIRYVDLHFGTWTYDVRPAGLTVSVEGEGNPRKELCKSPIPIDQVIEWRRFLSALPLDKLASEYVDADPLGEDGGLFYFTFSVQKAGGGSRAIKAAPAPPAELAALCYRVMALVPADCVRWPKLYCERTK